jgi:hypothetical protein
MNRDDSRASAFKPATPLLLTAILPVSPLALMARAHITTKILTGVLEAGMLAGPPRT